MRKKNQIVSIIINTFLLYSCQVNAQDNQEIKSDKIVIHMILGSTRQGRMADKIADALELFRISKE